jgi:ankyrin repeat protein
MDIARHPKIQGFQTMAQAARKGTVAELKVAVKSLRKVKNPIEYKAPNYPLDEPIARQQQTALHLAAHHGNIEIIKYLIGRYANLNVKDAKNNTPAHVAAIHDQKEALQLLLDGGANRSLKNNDALTPEAAGFLMPAYQAILKGNSRLLGRLLTRSQNLYPRINDQDDHGNTLLHYAAIKGDKYCVRVLIKLEVNRLLSNKMGETPGLLAARSGNVEIAQQLHPYFLPANRR